MKEKLLRLLLQKYRVAHEMRGDTVAIRLKPVNRSSLKREGQAVPSPYGKKDTFYHNYVYPDGLVPGIEHITITKDARERRIGRIATITLPATLIPDVIDDSGTVAGAASIVGTANLIYGTEHTVAFIGTKAVITVDNRVATMDQKLVEQLVSALQPRIPSDGDIAENIHYISDVGRLATLINLEIPERAKDYILNPSNGLPPLLTLRDPDREIELSLDRSIFDALIEKQVREEGLLTTPLKRYLGYETKNWISPDLNLLRRYEREPNDLNAIKLRAALESQADLYITTTNGGHAFSIKVDFTQGILFLANPSGAYANFRDIIDLVKAITGCTHEIPVITQPMSRERSHDLPFSDTCTMDALVVADFMMNADFLYEGCLNESLLTTTSAVEASIDAHLFVAAPVSMVDLSRSVVDHTPSAPAAAARFQHIETPAPSAPPMPSPFETHVAAIRAVERSLTLKQNSVYSRPSKTDTDTFDQLLQTARESAYATELTDDQKEELYQHWFKLIDHANENKVHPTYIAQLRNIQIILPLSELQSTAHQLLAALQGQDQRDMQQLLVEFNQCSVFDADLAPVILSNLIDNIYFLCSRSSVVEKDDVRQLAFNYLQAYGERHPDKGVIITRELMKYTCFQGLLTAQESVAGPPVQIVARPMQSIQSSNEVVALPVNRKALFEAIQAKYLDVITDQAKESSSRWRMAMDIHAEHKKIKNAFLTAFLAVEPERDIKLYSTAWFTEKHTQAMSLTASAHTMSIVEVAAILDSRGRTQEIMTMIYKAANPDTAAAELRAIIDMNPSQARKMHAG